MPVFTNKNITMKQKNKQKIETKTKFSNTKCEFFKHPL